MNLIQNKKYRLGEAFLFLISFCICLLLGEIMVRIIKRDIAYQPDPEVIRSLRPNIEYSIPSFETEDNLNSLSTTIPKIPNRIGTDRTNNVGFRMSKDVFEKKQNEKRVLLLGDSYTEANNVVEKDRFFFLADNYLKSKDKNWNILNGGIQNGSPSQYSLQIRKYLPLYKPDYVVVVTGANDFEDDYNFERAFGFVFDQFGIPLKLKNTLSLKLLKKSFLLRYLYVLVSRTLPKLLDYLGPPANPNLPIVSWRSLLCANDPKIQDRYLQKTGRYLVGIKQLVEQAGAHFGVLVMHYNYVFPEPYYHPRFPNLEEELRSYGCNRTGSTPFNPLVDKFLSSNKIEFQNSFDRFASFKKENSKTNLWGFWDYHFSPEGHKLLAMELETLLLSLEQKYALGTKR